MGTTRTTIITAFNEKELERRIKDSEKRGMVLLKQGVDKKADRFVYWAKMEI